MDMKKSIIRSVLVHIILVLLLILYVIYAVRWYKRNHTPSAVTAEPIAIEIEPVISNYEPVPNEAQYNHYSIPSIKPSESVIDFRPIFSVRGSVSNTMKTVEQTIEIEESGHYRLEVDGVDENCQIALQIDNITTGKSLVNKGYIINGYDAALNTLSAGDYLRILTKQNIGSKTPYILNFYKTYDITGYNRILVNSALSNDSGQSSGEASELIPEEEKPVFILTGNTSDATKNTEHVIEITETGFYRLEISGLSYDGMITLDINNLTTDIWMLHKGYIRSGDEFGLNALSAGDCLKINVVKCIEETPYALSIFKIPEMPVITENDQVLKDSRVYTNDFYYTIRRTGRYRFDIVSEEGNQYDLAIYDMSDRLIDRCNNCLNGEGVTLYNLQSGEEYKLHITASDGSFGKYRINIGEQKEIKNVSDHSKIDDSIQFTDQRNVYYFTPKTDGDININLEGINEEALVDFCVYDELDLNNAVLYEGECNNNREIVFKNAQCNHIYELQVRQNTGLTEYTLVIN